MKFNFRLLAIFVIGITFGMTVDAFAAHHESLGESWSSIKTSLEDAEKAKSVDDALLHLQSAKTIYDADFREAAIELDDESNQLIQSAFSNIEQLLHSGNIAQAKLERQVVDKTIYTIAFLKIEQAIANDDAQQFLEWYTVMEKKFKISEKSNFETNSAVMKIQTDANEFHEYGELITEELLGIFKLKTFEEIEEAVGALDAGNLSDAKKFAYEGLYYYRTLHPSVEAKLGTETANELLHEMEEAIEVVESDLSIAEMKSEMEHIGAEVELIIREYEGGDTSEVGLALSGIKDRLVLVEVEYLDAVANGVIINQAEYDETVVFLNKAIELYTDNEDAIMSLSESDSSNLFNNLNNINGIVKSLEAPSEVSISVGKALNNVASLQELSGGVIETDVLGYIDNIIVLLNQAKSEYRNGNGDAAFELITEAYLDNYEFVEGPLAEVDDELMVKIEIDMREDLRSMIQSNEPVSKVDAQIDMILEDLEVARAVIPEFGTIALMILAISIVSVITLLKNNRFAVRI